MILWAFACVAESHWVGKVKNASDESAVIFSPSTKENMIWGLVLEQQAKANKVLCSLVSDRITAWYVPLHHVLMETSKHIKSLKKQKIKTVFTLPYRLKWQAVAGLWVSTLCNSHYTVRCEKDALVSIQLWSRDALSLTVPIRGERGEGRRIRQEEKETIEVAERGDWCWFGKMVG